MAGGHGAGRAAGEQVGQEGFQVGTAGVVESAAAGGKEPLGLAGALQVALLVPLLAGLLGLINSFRMVRLPEPTSSGADGSIVLVMVNTHAAARTVTGAEGPTRFEYTMPGRSVGTFVWNSDRAGSLIRRAFRWLKGERRP